jgi:hypothetical protein|tara:strand:+ start:476 stop:622 length:147 start_codon:yes stop_codon:yes gene_type:complete
VKVKAPKGYHFMKQGKNISLMKHGEKYVPHKGASLNMDLKVIKQHKNN